MTTIFPYLEKKMIEKDIDVSNLAHLLRRSEDETASLLRGETEFTICEVIMICDYFNEPYVDHLLFPIYTNKNNRKKQAEICEGESNV